MINSKFHGVVVPMITPVKPSQKEGSASSVMTIDTESVEKIIESFAQSGVHPLLMGTTGEGNSVSPEDAVTLVRTAAKTAAGRITVYAGLTGTCYEQQLSQAEAFAEAGADVIAATLPSYYALTPKQMINYYSSLADSIKVPLMLYNITITTHMSITLEVIDTLSHHPNIVGLKDSENNLERLEKCIAMVKDRDDFAYFCGCAANSARALQLGADGIVPSTANFVPNMYQRLFEAGVKGDMETAQKLQSETDAIGNSYQTGRILGEQLAALKVVMTARGFCQPYMLMPLTRLTEEEEKQIVEVTKDFKDIE